MKQPPERFTTPRLVLRPVQLDDTEHLFDAYASDPDATRYLSWPTHETFEDTRGFVGSAIANWRDGSEFTWTLVSRDEDRPIGALGAADTPHGVEVGYVLGQRWWGNGFMTEALDEVMRWLRDQPSIYRVWAYCAVDHLRSAHVLERSGMTYEGTLRRWVLLPNFADEPVDAWVYSWIREPT